MATIKSLIIICYLLSLIICIISQIHYHDHDIDFVDIFAGICPVLNSICAIVYIYNFIQER
jgi:hypothetical protein